MGTPRLQIHDTIAPKLFSIVGDQTGAGDVKTRQGPPASGSLGDTRIHHKYS